MKKFIFVVFFLIQFFVVAQANAACNLAKFSFGSSIQDVEKKIKAMNAENLPATSGFIETEERHSIVFPGEEICKRDKSFIGAPVEMVFLENKLVEFRLFKFLEYGDRPELVNWAEDVYGEKNNKPTTFYDLEPSAFWLWDSSNSTVAYSLINIGYGIDEVVTIQSNQYQELFKKYSEKEDGL